MNNYREILVEKKTSVLAGLGAQIDRSTRSGRLNEEDQAQVSHEEFVSLSLNNLDHSQLRLIDAALDRLETGHYGVCLSCEEPIPGRRLDAIPWRRTAFRARITLRRMACLHNRSFQRPCPVRWFCARIRGG